ncbi:type II toxin-antitoxin system PemK/MazF family toxin [Clostridium sp. JNZ X4-2]
MPINIDLSRTQMYLEWLKTKLFLDSRASCAKSRIVKRGEVYKCNLGQNIGSEECKERPCVIIQYDAGNTKSPNTIVAPITHSNSKLPIVIPIADKYNSDGDVILDGNVLLGNIICVSKGRLGEFITNLEKDEIKRIDEAIAISLDIKRHYDKLNNILNDKLKYIDKLKNKVKSLANELDEKEKKIGKLKELLNEFGLKDVEELKSLIKSNSDKNM